MSGDTAVVGAYLDDCAAGSDCGAAYVFRFNGTSWVHEQKLTASDAASGDLFGWSVSLSGDTAVVGAHLDDCAAGADCGSAYVFRFNGTSWIQEQKLTASDAAAGDFFAEFVSISGDMVAVGARRDACAAGVGDCGAAYVFRFNGTSWIQQQKLTALDAAAQDNFGFSVSVSVTGNTVVVGAHNDGCAAGIPDCGAAYVFRFNGISWIQYQKLTASDAAASDLFGLSVCVNGDTAVVSALLDDCADGLDCGAAYVFSCVLVCGDGFVNIGEECDDSNTTAGDGCSATCMIESGFACTGEPSICSHDCNSNGIVDAIDITNATSRDCNGNGVPDECEIDTNSIAPGGPFFCMANCDPDCNVNGIPDECDIADCAGDPACGDCNLNGIPDGCEASTVCGSFVPSPVCASDDWSCPDNWTGDVPAGSFPDDMTSAAGISVTIGNTASVLLDVPVMVPTVDLETDSMLRITGPAGADLNFSGTAALGVSGDLQIDADHTIGAQTPHPALTIRGGGHYGKMPGATSVSASLTASSVNLARVPCTVAPCPAGGVLDLSDTMSLTVDGDVTIDGTGHGDCHPAALQGSVATFHAPPTHWVHDGARVRIGGSILFLGSASLGVSSLATVTIGGDFENRGTSPSCFDVTSGTLIFDGSQQQLFEVADTDVGQLPDILTAGYAVDEIILMSSASGGATVRFVDESDNDGNGQLSGCSEALYVRSLVLGANTTIILDQANVYFEQITANATAQIVIEPGACAGSAPPPLLDAGEIAKDRALAFVIPADTAGQQTALRVTLDSLYHPGAPIPTNPPDFSAREGETRYVNLFRDDNGDPVTSCLSSSAFSTTYPCATVGCTPEYVDWAGLFGGQTLYVSGSSVVPDSSYRVAQLASFCAGNESTCTAVSGELGRATARYGDVDDGGTTNVTDIVLTVDIVKDVFGASLEYQAYVRKESPEPQNDSVNVTDIVLHVDAVKLLAYPFNVPACP